VALLNAMMHVIVTEGLVDQASSPPHRVGYDALRDNVRAFPPERMAPSAASRPTPSAKWRASMPPKQSAR
jgi:anaerobic selenocysteine-containing dehydrogenase